MSESDYRPHHEQQSVGNEVDPLTSPAPKSYPPYASADMMALTDAMAMEFADDAYCSGVEYGCGYGNACHKEGCGCGSDDKDKQKGCGCGN